MVVEPIESLRKVVALRKIKLAILCVPAEAAQRVADLLVASGIRGILNFAPVPLDRAGARQPGARRPERAAREPGLQGPEDPGRSLDLLRRLAFPDVGATARMVDPLPGGETVSQQVLVLFFQVRILAG